MSSMGCVWIFPGIAQYQSVFSIVLYTLSADVVFPMAILKINNTNDKSQIIFFLLQIKSTDLF